MSIPEAEPSISEENPLISVEEQLASQEESSISKENPSILVEELMTSQEESSISKEKMSIPEAELSISEEDPLISIEERLTSREESSTSEENPSILVEELMTSQEESSTSEEKVVSISDEKPSILVEELMTSQEESSISKEKVVSISVEELASTFAEKLSFLKEEPSTSSEVPPAVGSSCSTKKNRRQNLESTLTTAAFPPTEEEMSENEKMFVQALNDEYEKVKANPPIEFMFPGKVNEVSDRKNEFGEELLKEKSYSLALTFFSKSVAYAEDGSMSQLQAYERRALTLFFLNAYDLCEEDADRALRVIHAIAGKDTDSSLQLKRQKLEQLKLKCLEEKEKLLDARGVTLMGPKRILGEVFLRNVGQSVIAPGRADDVEAEWRNLCQFDNASIPNASSKIRLGYDESKWGRYLKATQDLKAGEIVASQKCFALYVRDYTLWQECCSYCMKLNQILIPCQTCPYMMYCSIECRDTAFESYHRLECKFMSMFWEIGENSFQYYLIRPLLIGTEQGALLENLMWSMSIRDLMATKSSANQTFVDDYATFLQQQQTILPDQFMKLAPIIAKIIFMLERIGFFDGDSRFLPDVEHPNTLSKAQIFTAFLLLMEQTKRSNLLGLLLNSEDMREKFPIGDCLCTLYSAFNHSCNPNVEFLFRNRELVAFATRPIKKGEELVSSYFDTHKKLKLAERTKILSEQVFGFTCQCAFCTGGWPKDEDGYEKLELRFYNHIDQKRAMKELETLVALPKYMCKMQFMKLPTRKILDIILDVCEWLFTNMEPPSDLHIDIQHLVFVFMSLLYDQLNCVRSTVYPVLFAYDFLLKVADQNTNTFATASKKKKPRQ